jgi:AcrR family transcriptional regulator
MDPLGILPSHPTVGAAQPERSDAARNRARLLATARRIIDHDGAAGVTMDRLAAEAGVGKGTVFRRFGSRAGLFQALVDDVERDFQAAFLSGPPPLGPGAPPLERLVAFGRARLAVMSTQRSLMIEAERPIGERHQVPAHRVVELHIMTLLRQAGVSGDLPVLAFNLVAVLEAVLSVPETEITGPRLARFADGWEELVRRLG